MTGKIIVVCFTLMLVSVFPALALQTAIVPAYAYVSKDRSTIEAYREYVEDDNRVAARDLLRADKVFRSPKDIRVEIVKVSREIAKVKTSRLSVRAKPVTLYFWTLFDQLILLPEQDRPDVESPTRH